MTNLQVRIYALATLNELVDHLHDMKRYLHDYDYDNHRYTDVISDADGLTKLDILDRIESLIAGSVADQF